MKFVLFSDYTSTKSRVTGTENKLEYPNGLEYYNIAMKERLKLRFANKEI